MALRPSLVLVSRLHRWSLVTDHSTMTDPCASFVSRPHRPTPLRPPHRCLLCLLCLLLRRAFHLACRSSDWRLQREDPRSTRPHPTGSPAGQTRTDRQPLAGLVGLVCSCKLLLGVWAAASWCGCGRLPVHTIRNGCCFVFCRLCITHLCSTPSPRYVCT